MSSPGCLGLWQRAAQEREQAEQARHRADLTTQIMKDLIRVSDPSRPELPSQAVILERGRRWLDQAREDDPRQWADLAGVLASAYRDLGLYREALALMEEVLAVRRRLYPEDHPELAEGINNLAVFCFDLGEHQKAEAYSREALAIRRRLGQGQGIESVKTLNNLASILVERGSYDEAETLYRRGLEIRVLYYGLSDPKVATSLRSLANTLFLAGDPAAAESLLRRALEIRRQHYGPDHPRIASVLDKLGSVRLALGDLDEAESLFLHALAIERQILGDHHDIVAHTQTNLAELLLGRPEPTPEERDTTTILLRHALRTLLATKGPDVWEVARIESLLGAHLLAQGQTDDAEPCLEEGHRKLDETLGSRSIYTHAARDRLDGSGQGRARSALGRSSLQTP